MSRTYDAKQAALKAYPTDRKIGIELFFGYLGCNRSDFEYEEGMTAEEYVYGSKGKIQTPIGYSPDDDADISIEIHSPSKGEPGYRG